MHQAPLGHISSFANGFGNFNGLAQTDADAALFVARNHQGAKTETAPAFDNFGGAIDENHLFAQLGIAAALMPAIRAAFTGRATAPTRTATRAASASSDTTVGTFVNLCHNILSPGLKFQTAFAGGVGQCFDFAVVSGATPVKDNAGDAFAFGRFRR
jgi:hypothetical protein